MANTIGTPVIVVNGNPMQLRGLFDKFWTVSAVISDQDAVAIGDTARFALTVPGVALGDMVLGVSVNEDLSDGTDQAALSAVVTAANTVSVQINADAGEFAADTLNTKTVKILVARANF